MSAVERIGVRIHQSSLYLSFPCRLSDALSLRMMGPEIRCRGGWLKNTPKPGRSPRVHVSGFLGPESREPESPGATLRFGPSLRSRVYDMVGRRVTLG